MQTPVHLIPPPKATPGQRLLALSMITARLQRAFPRLLIDADLIDYGNAISVTLNRGANGAFGLGHAIKPLPCRHRMDAAAIDRAVLALGRQVLSIAYPHGLATPA